MIDKERLELIIKKFRNKKIMIIGDIILDEYIWGTVKRISPEAPVPIVEVHKQTYSLGGASYVATHIKNLGGVPYLVGVIGKDKIANEIKKFLKKSRINTSGVMIDKDRPTILKTRVIAHNQQVVRIDYEKKDRIKELIIDNMILYIKKHLKEVDALVISDYNKGVVIPKLFKELLKLSKKFGKPVIVDPKPAYCMHYKNATIITPNTSEAGESVGVKINDDKSLYIAGKKLLNHLRCEGVLITRGEHGMTLFEKKGEVTNIPTAAREVYDVTGAGDTVVSILALSLAGGANLKEASLLSNYAAGVVVGKLGTADISVEEIIKVIG
jgi:D-beta-D-heptose 7-phosphate kinase/D-beta-D-heptose 1-phosphate adenosyltransferase